MQMHDVLANQAATVYKARTDDHVGNALSAQTAEKCILKTKLV